jgi:hypothetical protein
MPDAVVVNASPLVFLGNAGRMDLLRAIGAARVIVPHAVLEEVTATRHTDLAARSVAEAGWIERAAPSPIPAGVTEWDLPGAERVSRAIKVQRRGGHASPTRERSATLLGDRLRTPGEPPGEVAEAADAGVTWRARPQRPSARHARPRAIGSLPGSASRGSPNTSSRPGKRRWPSAARVRRRSWRATPAPARCRAAAGRRCTPTT